MDVTTPVRKTSQGRVAGNREDLNLQHGSLVSSTYFHNLPGSMNMVNYSLQYRQLVTVLFIVA